MEEEKPKSLTTCTALNLISFSKEWSDKEKPPLFRNLGQQEKS
jgi:hypothetical protein